jgi:hypothetical protein
VVAPVLVWGFMPCLPLRRPQRLRAPTSAGQRVRFPAPARQTRTHAHDAALYNRISPSPCIAGTSTCVCPRLSASWAAVSASSCSSRSTLSLLVGDTPRPVLSPCCRDGACPVRRHLTKGSGVRIPSGTHSLYFPPKRPIQHRRQQRVQLRRALRLQPLKRIDLRVQRVEVGDDFGLCF